MLRPFAWLGQRLCGLVPALAILAGGVGAVLPTPEIEPSPEVLLVPGDVLQIDAVLARRAPELGLALRRRIAGAILDEAQRARFDPLFILGLIEAESSFDGEAVSWAGARGLMQLRPATLEYLAATEGLRLSAEDVYRDPALQIRLGIRYLSRLEKRFKSLDLALMAYNAGPQKLTMALVEGEEGRFRGYVQAVRRNFAKFRRGAQVDAALAQAQATPIVAGTE